MKHILTFEKYNVPGEVNYNITGGITNKPPQGTQWTGGDMTATPTPTKFKNNVKSIPKKDASNKEEELERKWKKQDKRNKDLSDLDRDIRSNQETELEIDRDKKIYGTELRKPGKAGNPR